MDQGLESPYGRDDRAVAEVPHLTKKKALIQFSPSGRGKTRGNLQSESDSWNRSFAMKAVSYEGTHGMVVGDHPKPKISKPTEALLRVTSSGICGSDLHMYDGRTALKEGSVVGHEIMGVIEEVG